MSTVLPCPYAALCSGCDWIQKPYEEQLPLKLQNFLELVGPGFEKVTRVQSFKSHGLRDRLDFVLQNGNRGLYQRNQRQIVDIDECLQLSPALQNFYSDFRKIKFPDMTGSFRLRISPQGKRGVWLDFSNQDIKSLLDEKSVLLELQEMAFVEIGQRHKALITKSQNTLGLGDPESHPWFQSTYQGNPVDLYSTVASFTQPSHTTNAWITKTLGKWFEDLKPQKVLEFGSGIGNLTLPALSHSETHILSLELDARAAEAQAYTLKKYNLQDRVDLRVGDFRSKAPEQLKFDTLLVNPARNGVGSLFEKVLESRPQNIIYMSCYPESYALDTQALISRGYSAQEIILVDQFPQTHHVEVLSRWTI